MGSRAVLVLGVLALAVLGAAWYAAGAPARSSGETVPAELVLSAVQTGSGSWVRYVVTVKNAGDVDFSGEIVLLNRADPLLGSGGQLQAPTAPPTQPKIPNQIPRLPAEAPDAGYEIHVVVPARQVVTRIITAPDRYTEVAAAQDPDGTVVQFANVDRSLYIPVAVLSTSNLPIEQLQGVRYDDWTVRVTEYQDAKTFPTSAAGLAGFVAVVVDQFPTLQLSDAQRNALRDFVGQGGSLVLAGGADWRRTLLGLPPELSPLRATGTATASLAGIAALAGRADDVLAIVATGDLQPGARAVAGDPAGRPLLVEGHHGGGLISALTFDPAAEPTASSALAGPAWVEALGRTLDHSVGTLPSTHTLPGVDATIAQALPTLHGAALPSPWLVGPLLLFYLLLVAPVNYLFLRRRRPPRPDLFWLTAPALAAVFTGAFYWLGTDIQGGIQDEELQVLHLAPNGSVAEIDYHQVVFRSRGDQQLEMVKPGLAAPLTFDLSDSSVALSGLPQGQEHVVPIQRPVVLEKGVVYGSVRILGTAATGRQPVGVEPHLAFLGGRIVGRILNTGKQPVHGIALYSVAGGTLQRTPLASLIPPGGAATVDSVPANLDSNPGAPIFGTNAPPDAMTRIARAVGITAVSAGTHPYLVGFTDPLPGALDVDGSAPTRSVTAIWQLPVTMEAADNDLGRWTSTHLAGVAGQRQTGFSDVYDIELPAQYPTKLQLGFDEFQYSKVEVWDWSAQAWAGGSWQDDPNNPGRLLTALAPGEVAAGLLRLRVTEVRLTWGAGLFVSAGA
ncbi:MAG TPA: hypothetical protein VF160_03880 [Candidatus Dormibacteraeota bacterium]